MREKIAQTDFIQIESDKKLEYDERERKRERVRERLKITRTRTASCTSKNCHFTYKVAALECMYKHDCSTSIKMA